MSSLTDREVEKFDAFGRVKCIMVDTGGGSLLTIDTAGQIKVAADITRSVDLGARLIDSDGTRFGLKLVNGKPRVSAMPYLYDIAEGNIADHVIWSKMGFSAGVGQTERDIAPWMTGPYVFPTGALTMTIASDSSQDTKTTGTGAWTISIYYLTTGFVEKTATIDMNGTGVVTIATDIYRINNARIATCGAGGAAAGNISIKSGAVTYGYISATKTRQRQLVYTVPILKNLYLEQVEYSSSNQKPGSAGGARFTLRANYDEKSGLVLQRGLFMPYKETILWNNTLPITFSGPLKFPATTDIKVSCVSLVADTADVACTVSGWIESA